SSASSPAATSTSACSPKSLPDKSSRAMNRPHHRFVRAVREPPPPRRQSAVREETVTHYDPSVHHRRSIRLRDYDYSQSGAYFVTISTFQDAHLFGEIVNETMRLNAYGQIVAEDWCWLAEQYEFVELDAFVVMPNHLHGIQVIAGPGGGCTSARPPVRNRSAPS